MTQRTKLDDLELVPGRGLFTEVLGSGMYGDDPGRALAEPWRNGAQACMVNDDDWDPSRIVVDIAYHKHHPLTAGPALTVTDRGRGFTEADIRRFCQVGGDGAAARHGGAGQKGIGRFAVLALRRNHDNGSQGFSICTRTAAKGLVSLLTMTPDLLGERHVRNERIESDATELGPLQNTAGKFSCIVIPDPVLRSHNEIADAVGFRLPRKQELCGQTTIGGKLFTPPPLESAFMHPITGTGIEVFLGHVTHDVQHGGIWLADATTGLRVAYAPNLSVYLPYPLGRHDLTGDIFVPDLLGHQDTSRGGLRKQFLQSAKWRKVVDLLRAEVVPGARGLLEDADVVGGSPLGDLIAGEIRELFAQTWGLPEGTPPNLEGLTVLGPQPPKPGGSPHGPRGPGGGGGGGGKPPPKPVLVGLKIGDQTYWIGNTKDDPLRFAVVRDPTQHIILVNRDYGVLPKSREARSEHSMLQLLGVIGETQYPRESDLAMRFATERRRELLEAKKRS